MGDNPDAEFVAVEDEIDFGFTGLVVAFLDVVFLQSTY